MKIVFSMFSKTMEITTILLVFIGLSVFNAAKIIPLKKIFSSFYDSGNLAFTKEFGTLTLNKQKKIDTTLPRKYTY